MRIHSIILYTNMTEDNVVYTESVPNINITDSKTPNDRSFIELQTLNRPWAATISVGDSYEARNIINFSSDKLSMIKPQLETNKHQN